MFMYFSLGFYYQKVPTLCTGSKKINQKWTPANKGIGGGQNRLKMHEYPLWIKFLVKLKLMRIPIPLGNSFVEIKMDLQI